MEQPTLPILRKDILVVEDNEPFRQTLCRSLEIEGFIVRQASNGQSALDLLRKARPDLIISDISMPALDGIEFYKAVRSEARWVTIPFIFVTAYDAPEEIQSGRILGVDDYLTKPIDHHELIKIVNTRLLRSAEIEIALINQSYIETVNVLANSIEGRDPYTHGHVERVAAYARLMAEALHWPGEQLRILVFGALLHDIGKIVVPDHVLKKAAPLTPEEWVLMKHHPLAGAKIIQGIHHLRSTLPYILHHHERWDGSGYPSGIAGRDIPIEGRLLAIVDVYDALTTARSYHPSRSQEEVIAYLRSLSGVHFDPDLTAVFIQTLEKKASLRPGH
jgi:putative two-component system response regulator